MFPLPPLIAAISVLSALSFLEVLRITVWQERWMLRGIGFSPSRRLMVLRIGVSAGVGIGLATWWGYVYASMAASAVVWLMLTAVETDLIGRKIPREPCWTVLLVGILGGLASLSAAGAVSFALAFIFVGMAMLLAALVTRGGLGSGDVRFFLAMTPLAWWIGTSPVLVAVLIACALQVIARAYLLLVRRAQTHLPFAPALSLGMLSASFAYPFLGGGACQEWAGILPCG